MEKEIRENLDHPGELEKLYRSDKKRFIEAFTTIYPEIDDLAIAGFWKARLEYKEPSYSKWKVNRSEVFYLIISCLMAGLLIKIPQLFGFDPDEDSFYMKNAGIILFMGLSAYIFLAKKRINPRHLFLSLLIFMLSALTAA